jgi:hypothetical protein
MTRELLQQALEALERMNSYGNVFAYRNSEQSPYDQNTEAIIAIREYLKRPEPEPVAWMTENTGDGRYAMWGQKPTSDYWDNNPEKLIPLYRKEE